MAKKQTSESKTTAEVQDNLSNILAESLNKKFPDYKVAYFLDGTEETPTDLTEWVSTGSSILDLAISNRPYGGVAVGRIIEIIGWEASGKSLLCSHIIAETQKKGGLPVFIDTENSVNIEFLEAIGVDTSANKFLYCQIDTIEQIFQAIEDIITKVRSSNKNRLVTIVVDSVTAALTKDDIEGNYEKEGWNTTKAIVMSSGLQKISKLIAKERILLIFTNQLRDKLGVSFGDNSTTSGGKALQFYASCRMRASQIKKIKAKIGEVEQIVGITTQVKIIKNRFGPPHRTAEFNIYFDRGIDNYSGWFLYMKDNKIFKQGGAWYTFVDEKTGEEVKFQQTQFADLMESREDLRNSVYEKLCETMIMKYKTKSGSLSYNPDEVKFIEGDEKVKAEVEA